MEKFEIDESKNVEIYSSFVEKAKYTLSAVIENIKTNIKNYEQRIKDTTKDVSDNEAAREKCEQEIVTMESKISEIKDAIENVENTYKKIADAYSSTSKGDTKDLYSKIIDDAKANCDKDVEKNRSEIAHLNSDIEGIKGDIANYTSAIDDLNKDLDEYNLELHKYNKTLEYFEKVTEKANEDLDEISNEKEISTRKVETRTSKSARKVSRVKDVEESSTSRIIQEKPSILETLKNDTYKIQETPKEENKSEVQEENKPIEPDFESSLKQIYDITGYKPKEEPVMETSKSSDFNFDSAPSFDFDFGFNTKEEPKTEDKKVYTDNLESLFSSNTPDIKEDKPIETSPFLDSDFSDWENILNSTDTQMNNTQENPISFNDNETMDELLKPYGTTYKRLCSLVGNTITYRDGTKEAFELNSRNLTDAINAIDGNDLKAMKKVGPEITILRKVKGMKEGNL